MSDKVGFANIQSKLVLNLVALEAGWRLQLLNFSTF